VASGKFVHGINIVKWVSDKNPKEAKDKDEKEWKSLQEYNELLENVQKIRQENKDPHQWNVNELNYEFFKHDGDAPLLPRKDGLYARYLEMRL